MSTEIEKKWVTEDEFLDRLAGKLGLGHNKERALQITKKVFRLLQLRLSPEKSERLVSLFPARLSMWYAEQREQQHQEEVFFKTLLEFAHDLVQSDMRETLGNFYGVEEVLVAIRAVLETIASYLLPTQVDEMISLMPGELKQLMHDWISHVNEGEFPSDRFNACDLTQ